MNRTKKEQLAFLQGQIMGLTNAACGPYELSNETRDALWMQRSKLVEQAVALTNELHPED